MIMLVMSGIVSKKAEAAVNVTAENGVTYSMNYYEKTAVVTGYDWDDWYYRDSLYIIIPEEYDGCKVVQIKADAFNVTDVWSLRSKLISITIPDTVSEIGRRAFSGCQGLESVTLPESLEIIYDYTFSKCSNLENINIPNSIKKIESYAFSNCKSLTNLFLPAELEELGERAFEGCENLSSVTFSGNPELGDAVFEDCSNLESVVGSESLTRIPSSTFSGCKNLRDFTMPEAVTYIGSGAFYGTGLSGDFTISETVTYIGSYAFSDCKNLSGDFTIPASVKDIGKDIIKGTAITDVYIWGNPELSDSFHGTLTLHGAAGYMVENYAKDKGMKFEALDIPENTFRPKTIEISDIKISETGNLVVGWNTTDICNMQLQYAREADFCDATEVETKTETQIVLSKLKRKKKYYFRIRCFEQYSDGTRIYGDWSEVKSKKIVDTNNKLSSIISTYGTWSQKFDPAIKKYTITLGKKTPYTDIYFETQSPYAKYYIDGKKWEGVEVTLDRKESTTIKVKVVAESGKIKTYTIKVKRK